MTIHVVINRDSKVFSTVKEAMEYIAKYLEERSGKTELRVVVDEMIVI